VAVASVLFEAAGQVLATAGGAQRKDGLQLLRLQLTVFCESVLASQHNALPTLIGVDEPLLVLLSATRRATCMAATRQQGLKGKRASKIVETVSSSVVAVLKSHQEWLKWLEPRAVLENADATVAARIITSSAEAFQEEAPETVQAAQVVVRDLLRGRQLQLAWALATHWQTQEATLMMRADVLASIAKGNQPQVLRDILQKEQSLGNEGLRDILLHLAEHDPAAHEVCRPLQRPARIQALVSKTRQSICQKQRDAHLCSYQCRQYG